MLWSNSPLTLQSSPSWLHFSSTSPPLKEHKVLILFASFDVPFRCLSLFLRWLNTNFFNSTGTASDFVYWYFSRALSMQRSFWILQKTVFFSLRVKLYRLNCDMELDHLGCLVSCKKVITRCLELVAPLLNRRSVQFEESSKRNAYTSNNIATGKSRLNQFLGT